MSGFLVAVLRFAMATRVERGLDNGFQTVCGVMLCVNVSCVCVGQIFELTRGVSPTYAVGVFVGVTVPIFFVGWHTSPTCTSARCRACCDM